MRRPGLHELADAAALHHRRRRTAAALAELHVLGQFPGSAAVRDQGWQARRLLARWRRQPWLLPSLRPRRHATDHAGAQHGVTAPSPLPAVRHLPPPPPTSAHRLPRSAASPASAPSAVNTRAPIATPGRCVVRCCRRRHSFASPAAASTAACSVLPSLRPSCAVRPTACSWAAALVTMIQTRPREPVCGSNHGHPASILHTSGALRHRSALALAFSDATSFACQLEGVQGSPTSACPHSSRHSISGTAPSPGRTIHTSRKPPPQHITRRNGCGVFQREPGGLL